MDYKGHTVLNSNTLPNSEGGSCMVVPGNWVTWKPENQASECDHAPLKRLKIQHGIGPFQISQILRTPTQQNVFEILKDDKVLELINEKYFIKW